MAAPAVAEEGMDTNMDVDEPTTSKDEVECEICCADQPKTEYLDLECGHKQCRDCLRMILRDRLMRGILKTNICEAVNCECVIPDESIRSLLNGEKWVKKYEQIQSAKSEMNKEPQRRPIADDSDAEMTDPPDEKSDAESTPAPEELDYEALGLTPPPELTYQARKIMRGRKTETAGDRHFAQWATLKNVSQSKLRGYHFDWWMFPWCEDAMTRPGYYVRQEDVIALLHHVDFQERYIKGLKTLIKLKKEKDIDIVMSSNDWWIHPSRKSKVYVSMDMFLFVSYGVLRNLRRKNQDADRVLIERLLRFRTVLIETFHELVPAFGMNEIEDELDEWCLKNLFLCCRSVRDYSKFRQISRKDLRVFFKGKYGQAIQAWPYRDSLDALNADDEENADKQSPDNASATASGDDEKKDGAVENGEPPAEGRNGESGGKMKKIQNILRMPGRSRNQPNKPDVEGEAAEGEAPPGQIDNKPNGSVEDVE